MLNVTAKQLHESYRYSFWNKPEDKQSVSEFVCEQSWLLQSNVKECLQQSKYSGTPL